MKENNSPEEKLLKLIRGEKRARPAAGVPAQEAALHKKHAPPAAGKLPQPAKNPFEAFSHIRFTQALIQRVLIACVVISFLYLLVSFLYPFFGLTKVALPVLTEEEKNARPVKEVRTETKSYDFYLQGIKNKQLFVTGTSQESSTQEASAAPMPLSGAGQEAIKDIGLIGIISSNPPQAIVEDKKAQKNYYLSKGQFIGEFQVAEIEEGKIILNYKGQKYELYL